MDDLLRKAIESGASDIHISAGYSPVFRIQGSMTRQQLPTLTAENIKYLCCEVMSEGIRHEFEIKKEIDLSHEIPNFSRFRLNVFQEVSGIGLVFRVIPTKIPELDDICAPAILREMCNRRKGLILVTGPTGSGKSTTLATMINHINQTRKEHIITIEDPVEFIHKPILSKITQREVKVSTHSFADALRSALREDPNIILVGEMRDLETIELAIVAAETGHLVLGTVHTP
jgi:twitching motility protein PilT